MKITIGNLRKLIRESIGGFNVKYLYHGTTKSRADEIKNHGFNLTLSGEKSGAPMPGISTSTERSTAADHARWASKKFRDKPAVIKIDGSNLRVAPGSLYFQRWNELGNSEKAIQNIKDSNEWDGVALFDPETGEGIEEFEVLIFDPAKITIAKS